jgi:uncharacterized membrane protein
MQTAKTKHISNMNFTVIIFFGLILFTLGFYLGLMAGKGPLVETLRGTGNATVYDNIWQNRTDIFNMLLIAVAYCFIMIIFLVIFGRFRLNRDKKDEINNLERLGVLYDKGLLTRDEFDRKKSELLDNTEE